MAKTKQAPGDKCFWCGCKLAAGKKTRDHLLPRAWGGTGLPNNVVASCEKCNQARGRVVQYWSIGCEVVHLLRQWAKLSWKERARAARLAWSYEFRIPDGLKAQKEWAARERKLCGASYSDRERLPRLPPAGKGA